ncbi:L-asparaginase [Melghirimyces thermohalophilus]|uniref:asparaginase n=1 Tax=Melghirimyces thermohalophilus TaxID=1236220 RepID=A0A1G6PLB6_9BACL|nr:asparaginase [Melghirimyces thermohalophilus]SDC80316.1 L-asparaginase [Melghirimyces thermohalophilus]
MKKIKLIATGGTISGRGIHRLDLKDYQSGFYTGDDLLREIPEIREIADIDVEQMTNVGSSNISPAHWLDLKNRIERLFNEEDYDGVVITHGTSTLEETAYFLHLTVHSHKPVVLVGSQRPFSAIGSDAPFNLINAVRVASEPASIGKGVLVVLNDEINCAREATKANTYRVEAFQSGQLGLLGYVDPDRKVQFYRSPSRKHTVHSQFSKLSISAFPKVAILYSHAGADQDLIQYIIRSGRYQGIVLAGTGGGHCTSEEKAGLIEAVERDIHVVRSSRVGNGRVVMLNRESWQSCITADNLLPHKARILLMLSLLVTQERAAIQQIFDEY